MTIRTKLTVNILLVLITLASVSATAIIGMRFIKVRLTNLTERSTPFQMRTAQFQVALQSAASSLGKLGTAATSQDFSHAVQSADAAMEELRHAQERLENLSNEKRATHDELSAIYRDLQQISGEKVKGEEEARAILQQTNQTVTQISQRLRQLDHGIKSLQQNRSGQFVNVVGTKELLARTMRSIEVLKLNIVELKANNYATHSAKNPASALKEMQKTVGRIQQNGFVRDNGKLRAQVKKVSERVDSLNKAGTSEASLNQLTEELNTLIEELDDAADPLDAKYQEVNNRQDGLLTQSNTAVSALTLNSELVALGTSVGGQATRLFTAETKAMLDQQAAELQATFQKIDAIQRGLEQSLGKLGAKQELASLRSSSQSLAGIRTILFASDGVLKRLARRMEIQTQSLQMTQQLQEIVNQQTSKGKETVSTAQGEQERSIASVNRMVNTSLILIIGIFLVAVLIGVLFGIWIYRSISRPLAALLTTAEKVAQGDLSGTDASYNASNDEVGKVRGAVAAMVQRLREVLGSVASATHSLAASSEQLEKTAISLGDGSVTQRTAIEISQQSMLDLASVTGQVSDAVRETANAAEQMRNATRLGKEAMHGTANELGGFAGMVRESAVMIESLNEQSSMITSVVDLIEDIADQTGLLSLNAAIEAARAGEGGRGFSVVADNVRRLAARTTEATQEIAGLLGTMQNGVGRAVSFMHTEQESLDRVMDKVQRTMAAIDDIAILVDQVSAMMEQVSSHTGHQMTINASASERIQEVGSITEDLTVSVEQIRESSGELFRLAGELQKMMNWFRT